MVSHHAPCRIPAPLLSLLLAPVGVIIGTCWGRVLLLALPALPTRAGWYGTITAGRLTSLQTTVQSPQVRGPYPFRPPEARSSSLLRSGSGIAIAIPDISWPGKDSASDWLVRLSPVRSPHRCVQEVMIAALGFRLHCQDWQDWLACEAAWLGSGILDPPRAQLSLDSQTSSCLFRSLLVLPAFATRYCCSSGASVQASPQFYYRQRTLPLAFPIRVVLCFRLSRPRSRSRRREYFDESEWTCQWFTVSSATADIFVTITLPLPVCRVPSLSRLSQLMK
ncbi:hypothetical protein F4780DRAFT_296208 [Xylariomycetidae sp. FL0641]|nr:hypothetical protein F4780DRAFT_296208 [Xylariomycetidae sp. FL0641]